MSAVGRLGSALFDVVDAVKPRDWEFGSGTGRLYLGPLVLMTRDELHNHSNAWFDTGYERGAEGAAPPRRRLHSV